MKSAIALLFLASLVPSTVFASGVSTYHVEYGDTLWNIAGSELGNPWCWPLIAAVPENRLDYQGALFAGTTLVLPSREECDAILRPVRADSVRTETIGYAFDDPWYASSITAGMYLDRKLGIASGLSSYSRYDDMFDPNDPTLYRERDGDTWYVMSGGVRSAAWDYVDHVLRNDVTGSVFYRARDIGGNWYLVKNEVATAVPFEPSGVYLIDALDEVVGVRTEEGQTRASSTFEEWMIPVKATPVSVNASGQLLMASTDTVSVDTLDTNGRVISVCDSTVCSARHEYWLGGQRVATSTERMIPLFSATEAPIALPFYFTDGTQKAFKYYGTFSKPSFDAEQNLVLYGLFDSRLSRYTVDLP